MDTSKSILIASIFIATIIAIAFLFHRQDEALHRQDTACVNLFNSLGDGIYTNSSIVELYSNGQLKEEIAKGIRFAEKMHGITFAQCMKR